MVSCVNYGMSFCVAPLAGRERGLCCLVRDGGYRGSIAVGRVDDLALSLCTCTAGFRVGGGFANNTGHLTLRFLSGNKSPPLDVRVVIYTYMQCAPGMYTRITLGASISL